MIERITKQKKQLKKLLIVLLLFSSLKSYSQKLELYGNVEWYSLKEKGKIFWTEAGKYFDNKKYITYDKNKKFNFKIDIKKIKDSKIKVLVFAIDSSQNTTAEYACVHKINVLEIVNSSEFKNRKNIKLKTDLILDVTCTARAYGDAEMENKERFVGFYNLTINDTLRNVKLDNIFLRYTSKITKQTKEYMNEEFGSWEFNEKKNKLTFYVWRQLNSRYGLMLRKNIIFEFPLKNASGNIMYQSKKSVLTRNN